MIWVAIPFTNIYINVSKTIFEVEHCLPVSNSPPNGVLREISVSARSLWKMRMLSFYQKDIFIPLQKKDTMLLIFPVIFLPKMICLPMMSFPTPGLLLIMPIFPAIRQDRRIFPFLSGPSSCGKLYMKKIQN